MLQNLVVEYEKLADPRLPACSRKAGQLLETCCTIMDMKGVGISNAGQVYGYLQSASGISQNHYPERLGKLYIINAPWGFSGVFAVVKRFLDPVTVAKIHVLGGSYQKELLSQVPEENLPSEFGGKCNCPGGCALSDEGPCKSCINVHLSQTSTDPSVTFQGRTKNGRGPPRGRRAKKMPQFQQQIVMLARTILLRLMGLPVNPKSSLLAKPPPFRSRYTRFHNKGTW
jgi:hypothetical protein